MNAGPQPTDRAGGGIISLPCFRPVEPQQSFGTPVQAFMSAQTPIMRRLFIVAALAAALAFAPAGVPARAQAAAPFDGSLQRLAEILGALHYLRNVCGANEGQKWRNEMQSLIDAEAPSGDRRLRMIASFNRGYRGYQQSYRTCTKIAREMTARYAN